MSTHIPDPDAAEDESDRELDDAPVDLPDDANPADVWEQSQAAPFDEDEREGD